MSTQPTQLKYVEEPVIKMRAGQRRCFRLVDQCRLLAFVARRQYGKTTTFGNIALKKMMKKRDHTVIFGSAKLNLSREIVRKESEVIGRGISEAMRRLKSGQLLIADAESGKIPDRLTADDFAEMFEAQRLEFRFFHDRGSYSRTKVVALRPDTVGETGDLMCDEIGRINNWREVWEAVEPIVSSNPDFRLLLSTTPPPDDTHYSFEQLAPPIGTEFPINPEGNVYEVGDEMTVLRIDAFDAYADGVPVYSLKSGKPMAPEAHRKTFRDKDAWDRNYWCKFLTGGSAAIGLVPLMQAQAEGAARGCRYFQDELPVGWVKLCGFVPGIEAAIGVDPATTENETSNPTGFCASQMDGNMHVARALMRYKKENPKEARAVISGAIDDLKAEGIPVKCAVLDGTSEKYWCLETREELESKCPVLIMVSSEREEVNGENLLMKTVLGTEAVATFDDRAAAIPPDKTVKDDFRLPRRFKGGFNNELDAEGNHGDMFDGYKLALRGHLTECLETAAEAVQVGAPRVTLESSGHSDRMTMRPTENNQEKRGELWT